MANQWNATIATQTVAFRGTSTVDVKVAVKDFHDIRSIAGAAYSLLVAGGVSGNFSVVVSGFIGGATFQLAGVTAVTAAGAYALYPIGYSSSGAVAAIPLATNLGDAFTFTNIVPPARVHFVANTSTAGISANCTVAACLYR